MSRPTWIKIAATLAGVLLILAIVLASLDWGLFKGTAERRLSAALGRPVTIGRLTRIDRFGLTPLLRFEDVRVAQPAWAGHSAMLTVRRADIRLPLLPLLAGRVQPRSVAVTGLRASLLHMPDPRANWKIGPPSTGGPLCVALTVADAKVGLVDLKRHIRLQATVTADAQGFRIAGRGTHRGVPLSLSLAGPAIDGAACDAPYAFAARAASSLAALSVDGRMAGDFNTAAFTARASAHGQNLEYLDDFILAGLPGTQPFRVGGTLRRASPDWMIERMDGTIGRSTFAGPLKILKRDTRTILDGDIRSTAFAPDDLASNEGKARAAARIARTGARILPYFAIDLTHMRDTSGRLGIIIDRLLLPPGSPFASARATARMESGLLTLQPLTIALTQGMLSGRVRVDHRHGTPKFSTNLTLSGARLGTLLKGQADAPLSGHIRLAGAGPTIRDALARSDGEVTLSAKSGWIKASTAQFLGENASAGLFAGRDERAALNFVNMRMKGQGGVLRASPFIIDTDVSRADVTGTVNLADERIAMRLAGHAKTNRVIRLPAPIEIGGTLARPDIGLAPVKGGILGKVGRALGLKR